MSSSARAAIRGTIKLTAEKPRLAVGDFAEWSRQWTQAHVTQFAELGGDDNPVHVDADYAATTQFKRPIVHGMLYGSMFGTIFGAQIPGSIYMSQSFKFRKPVYVGDTVTARVEVKAVRDKPHIITCSTTLSTEAGLAMDGEAKVLIMDPDAAAGTAER